MTTTQIDQLSQLNKRVEEQEALVVEEFQSNLRDIFVQFPELRSVSASLNNHEFNDGDATYFSVYYENMTIVVAKKDEQDEEIQRSDYGKDKNTDHPILKELYSLFSRYESVMETLYGNKYGEISINRSSLNITTE